MYNAGQNGLSSLERGILGLLGLWWGYVDEFRLVVIGRWPNNGSSYGLDIRISRLFYVGVFQKQQTCARHTEMFRRTFIIPLNNFVPSKTLFERGLSGCKKLLARLKHKNRTMLIPCNVLYYSAVEISGSAVANLFRLQL